MPKLLGVAGHFVVPSVSSTATNTREVLIYKECYPSFAVRCSPVGTATYVFDHVLSLLELHLGENYLEAPAEVST